MGLWVLVSLSRELLDLVSAAFIMFVPVLSIKCCHSDSFPLSLYFVVVRFACACSFKVAAGQIVSMIASGKLLIPRNFKDNLPRPSKKPAETPIFALLEQ